MFSKKDIKEVTFRIDGMHCEMCTKRMRSAFCDTKGVIDAQVSLSDGAGSAIVKYDANKLSPQELKNKIIETGYTPVD